MDNCAVKGINDSWKLKFWKTVSQTREMRVEREDYGAPKRHTLLKGGNRRDQNAVWVENTLWCFYFLKFKGRLRLQWLWLCAPLPRAQVQSLVEELRLHRPRRWLKKKNLRLTTNKMQMKCKTLRGLVSVPTPLLTVCDLGGWPQVLWAWE